MTRGPEQQEFRKSVLERDGHECQYCGRGYEPGNGLQAHHIKPVSEGGKYTLENGITLCKQHHDAVHVLRDVDDGPPLEVLEKHDVPKEFPNHPALEGYVNWRVWRILQDEYQVNPRLIRDITGLERQRVNDALDSLVAAGWVERRTRGLYRLVYDGDGYVTMKIEYKET